MVTEEGTGIVGSKVKGQLWGGGKEGRGGASRGVAEEEWEGGKNRGKKRREREVTGSLMRYKKGQRENERK